jgi:hypothetical protein
MTSLIASHPPLAAASRPRWLRAVGAPLGAVVVAACDVVAALPLADHRWEKVGVRLTAVVDAVGRSSGLSGIADRTARDRDAGGAAADLGWLVHIVTPSGDVAVPEGIEDVLWSLQVAAA